MKKSFLAKSFAGLCATTFLVGTVTWNLVRIEEPKSVDFSAFKNAAANIQFIASNNGSNTLNKSDIVVSNIVSTIDKEVVGKIQRSQISFKRRVVFVEPKVAPVAKIFITSSDYVPGYEINNSDLIKLYGYEADSLSYDSFANTVIASIEVPTLEVKEDAVNVAQASTTTQVEDVVTPAAPPVAESVVKAEPVIEPSKEEIAQAEIATKENPVNDDLVVFDYSDKEAPVAAQAPVLKKTFDGPISDNVKSAIERELHKSPAIAMNTQKRKVQAAAPATSSSEADLEKIMADEDNLVFDYSQQSVAGVTKKETAKEQIAAFMAPAKDMSTQAEFVVKAQEVNLNTLKTRQVFGFEFVPDYDRSERSDDATTGELKLGYSLSGDVNTQTGVLQSQGLISTRVELNLLNKGMTVPMFNENGIQKFLQKKKTDVEGNLLMVAVDPSITDVEIDSESQYKVFLSEKFKLVETQADAAYVLFLGVRTGNISLRYLLDNKESAQKIIYVGDGEMYYEDADFVNTERQMYTFTTRSLLGRKVKELNIDGSDISFFGTKTTAKKKALNAYEIKVPELVDNSRKYLEFKHLGTNSLFVGTQSTNEIEIPGKDFIGKVLEANDLSEIGERCLVQVNLTKDLRDIKASGKNKSGEMFVETTFLDNDGNFSRDNSELSEKVFVSGDMEGIFSVRLDYTDGTTDFLKTFCSEGSYLVEQL